MKIQYRWSMISFLSLLVIAISFQNCSSNGFQTNSKQTVLSSDSDPIKDDDDDEVEKVTVEASVALGRGGAVLTSFDGFKSLVHVEQFFTPGETYDATSILAECSIGKFAAKDENGNPIKDENGNPISAPYVPDHDPHMVRGVTYGNGMFVAVGGCCYPFSKTSIDGINWSENHRMDESNRCTWAGDVAFGNGVFASLGGGTSSWSADGKNWAPIQWKDNKTPSGSYRRVMFLDGHFYAFGNSKAILATSSNGINWELMKDKQLGSTVELESTVGDKGNGKIIVLDGTKASNKKRVFVINASEASGEYGHTFAEDIRRINFDRNRNIFLINTFNGNVRKLYSSEDGVNWIEVPANTPPDGKISFNNLDIHGITPSGHFFSFKGSYSVEASVESYVSDDGLAWKLSGNDLPFFNPVTVFISESIQIPISSLPK